MTKSKKGVLKFVKKGDSSLMHGRATEGVLKFEKKLLLRRQEDHVTYNSS